MFTQNFLLIIICLIICLTFHEAAHALAAHKLGDDTAKNQGRLTLNPFKHLSLWGSIMFILVQFGWGKPVPVNPAYFKNPRRDQAFVALAGPLSNLLLALISGLFLIYLPATIEFTYLFTQINIGLAIFNLIPIPPLDGSKIIALFMNDNQYGRYVVFCDNYSAYMMIFVLFDIWLLPDIIGISIIGTILNTVITLIQALLLAGL